jgi:hypothetical protein
MASQITHVALAYRALPLLPAIKDLQPYIIGSIFPDMRYLGVVPREVTHDPSVMYSQVLNEHGAFKVGVLLHNLIDKIREGFVTDAGLYYHYPDRPATWTAMKLYEDEFYYPEVENWDTINRFLNDVYTQEMEYGISQDDAQHWHMGLQAYFSQPPTPESQAMYAEMLGTKPEFIDECLSLLNDMKNDEFVINCIRSFSDQVITLIQKS